MRSFARGTKAALSGKFGRASVRSALLFYPGVFENPSFFPEKKGNFARREERLL
jgi:hypothetical protein